MSEQAFLSSLFTSRSISTAMLRSLPTVAITAIFLCSCGIINIQPETTTQLIKVNQEYLGNAGLFGARDYWRYIYGKCLEGAITEEAFKRDLLEKGAVVITAVPYEEIISINNAPEESLRNHYDGKCKGTRYTVKVQANARLLGPS